jgi:hypothetical protein
VAFLVTPYVKFQTNFLWMELAIFHVTATMSREDAQYGLKSPNLKVRFPHGQRLFSAATTLVGIGMAKGKNSLRLTLPTLLENDDNRRAFRVDKVGSVPVTFSSRKYDLLIGKLVNLSTGGAKIFLSEDFEDGEISVDDPIHVTIPLISELTINSKARVRHVKDRNIGLEFWPPLAEMVLDLLSRWVFQKKEESLSLSALPGGAPADGHPGGPLVPMVGEPLIALIGGPPELEEQLRSLLAGLPTLRRFPANVQTVKALAPLSNTLALFFVESTAQDCLKRTQVLLELLQGKIPFFILATAIDSATLIGMANQWKAVNGCSIGAIGNSLLPRMVAGIFKKQFNLG